MRIGSQMGYGGKEDRKMCETRNPNLLGKITVLVIICCFSLKAHAKYGGGSGTPDDPYQIRDANHMQAIGADANDWDKHFNLMADVNLGCFDGKEGRETFNMIGEYIGQSNPDNRPFTGVFEGNGKKIFNFSYSSTGIDCIGVFAYFSGENAQIKNLGLINPTIQAGTGKFVGSLVGRASGGTIKNCYVEGGSASGRDYVGGLVGRNREGTITNCCSAADVSGDYDLGGLCGWNYGTITNSYSRGNVRGIYYAGGLVGQNYRGTITNCYSAGSVLGYGVIGGLVGSSDGIIIYCYSAGSVTGSRDVGGLVGAGGAASVSFWDIETSGQPGSASGSGKTTAQMQTASTFIGWGGCGNEVIWTLDEGNDYPHLWWEDEPGEPLPEQHLSDFVTGDGTKDYPYRIHTPEQLNMIGLFPCEWDKRFLLCADIDLTGYIGTSFNMIGGYYVSYYDQKPFTGVFDGSNHTISNLTYTSKDTDNRGLLGYVHGGEIKDLGLIDPNVDAGSGDSIGSLVGYLQDGTISNCYVEGGAVSGTNRVGGLVGRNRGTVTKCYSTASVSGYRYVGGLVGEGYFGTINNCCSTASVSGNNEVGGLAGSGATIINCYSAGSVSGNRYVGGLGGTSRDIIADCYSTASVAGHEDVGGLVGSNGTNATITNCYATGSVTAHDRCGGGLAGRNYRGIVINSFSTGCVTGDRRVGGLVGENGGTITNSCSRGSVSGDSYRLGGLVGHNEGGTITNCYSTASVAGSTLIQGYTGVGGLVGHNYYGTITNCYSIGSVSGNEYIGGMVGWNDDTVSASFWDIQTSGQDWSHGGTGLPTDQMQIQVTFTGAGWDFVGETVNAIEDIWFIPRQDYPHLWWEGMQVPMKLTPRTLNCQSKGSWIKTYLTLPEGFNVADVDSDRPAVLHSFGFQSAPLYVFVNNNGLVQIEAAFERSALCSLAGDWPDDLTVAAFLTDGNIFLGTSKVRIIAPGIK